MCHLKSRNGCHCQKDTNALPLIVFRPGFRFIVVIRRRNLKCNQGISLINNNAVKSSELQIEHVALFSFCGPLIFVHADETTELAATINDFARLTYRFNLPESTARGFCKGQQGRSFSSCSL